jgi:hypothetical protein
MAAGFEQAKEGASANVTEGEPPLNTPVSVDVKLKTGDRSEFASDERYDNRSISNDANTKPRDSENWIQDSEKAANCYSIDLSTQIAGNGFEACSIVKVTTIRKDAVYKGGRRARLTRFGAPLELASI